MAFSLQRASQGSSTRRRRHTAGFCEINVTPLVDVMLVLLVVFMITAPMMTSGIPLDLPKTKAAKLTDQTDPIIVSVDEMGRSYLHKTELSGEALIARLIAVTEQNPEAKIYVRGDAKLAYGRIMEVMGEIAAAGFTKVSLLAEIPAGGMMAVKGGQGLGSQNVNAPMSVTTGGGASSSQGKLPTLQSLVPSPVSTTSPGQPVSARQR